MKYTIILALLLCSATASKASTNSAELFKDTITNLSLLKKTAVYKAPNGKMYHVSLAQDEENTTTATRPATASTKHNPTAASANAACDHGNNFDGSYRKTAKTSIANHNAAGTNLAKLINRVVAMDNAAISVTANSPRIVIEDSVVTLLSVFLYAIARETDEDYHIIIGTSSNPATAKFFNIECSGLPASSNPAFSKIKTTRDKVVALLGGTERCTSGYVKFSDHPKVKIIGSLLYDKEHEGNIPGPTGNKPQTAWELHPIIEFQLL